MLYTAHSTVYVDETRRHLGTIGSTELGIFDIIVPTCVVVLGIGQPTKQNGMTVG